MKKQYSIQQVAKLLGVSADAIRLYEKSGLVKPNRNEKNGYRSYDAEQIHRIMGISLYRKIDVSIAEIKRISELSDFPSVIDEFDNLIEEYERQTEELQMKMEKVKFMKNHLKEINSGIGRYSGRELPVRYIMYSDSTGEPAYERMAGILSTPIFSFGNFCYVGKAEGNGEYSTKSLQFVIREPMLALCPEEIDKEKLIRQEKCSCLYTVSSSRDAGNFVWEIQDMCEYAEKQGFQCGSEAYAFYIYSLMGIDTVQDYYEIYLPIEKNEKS